MEDFPWEFVVWLLIAAVAGVASWIRGLIDRARRREGQSDVDVKKRVRETVDTYMKTSGEFFERRAGVGFLREQEEAKPTPQKVPPSVPPRPPATVPTRMPPSVSLKVVPEAPVATLVPRAPPPAPRVVAHRMGQIQSEGLVALRHRTPGKIAIVEKLRRGTLNAEDVRRAIVLAELLGPPVAERREHRLF